MKNYSIWSEELKNNYQELNTDLDIDVLIIGGGMTGINTAYQLINSNLKVCLVEKNIIGSGVTSRTTGKLTYLQENIYSKLKLYHDEIISRLYLDSQIEAINLAKDIIDKEHIECNLEKASSYVINNNDKKFNEEKELLNKFNIKLKTSNILPNKEKVTNSYSVDDTYVFHPIKYLNKLAKIITNNNINIFEHTKIISINKKDNYYICKTNNNTIKTKYIVLAIHYPYFLYPFFTPLKTWIEKSYIGCYKVKKNYLYSSITITKPTISTRYITDNSNNYKIYLSNSHNLCIKNDEIKEFNQLFSSNKEKEEYAWSNKDIMTTDSLPFIGSINNANTLLIGTGYNTWGMTNSILAGKILADIILKRNNKYIKLFNPKREVNLGKIINTPLIIGSNIYSFTKSKIAKQKSWYPSNIKFEKRNGKNIAIYIDEDKKEHIVYNLCPHLKCSLIFNEIEKTWDCPCHGSRFDVDGICIEGPSNYNITYKE